MKASRVTFRQPASLLFSIVLAGSICPANAQSTTTTTTTTTTAPAAAPAQAPAPTAAQVGDQSSSSQQQVQVLTPFEVNSTKDQGYFTANTLAGTRLNNNIADLPSSISVITKQQLEDTGSQNINDVFRYEANVEGARTYTPTGGSASLRSNLADGLSGGALNNSSSASNGYQSALDTGNRVRGLSTADIEVDNFYSLYRIPFDSYNADAIEIERGPNSIIFGTGSPAGIVNEDTPFGNVNKISGDAVLETGSWGKKRETFSLNVPVIKDMLNLYFANMYDSEGFKQQPASDITRRLYGAFNFYPFKSHKTKFSGMIESYNNYANDPNYTTPIDDVTPWIISGRPIYNPINDTVTYLATGKTSGPYAVSSTYPNYAGILQTALTTTSSPYFVPGLTYTSAGHDIELIGGNGLESMYKAQQTGFSIAASTPTVFTPAQALVAEERMAESSAAGVPGFSSPFLANGSAKYLVYQAPDVTSTSVYDWRNVSTASIDNTQTNATTYNLNFEQIILPDLTFQVAFFRQELHQTIDSPTDQGSASTMLVDTNSFLLNGSPNLHEGQPFLDVYQADVYSFPEINTNWRGMIDYEPDLRDKVPGWLEWIGHHRFLGVYTQHDDVNTGLRFRPSIDAGDPNYMPTAATLANAAGYAFTSNSALEQWFYLAQASAPPTGQATMSAGPFNRPGYGGPTQLNITSYNYSTNQWVTTGLHVDSVLFNTGGLTESLQDSKTFFWQSFFFDDRLVGSVGINDDEVKNRQTVFPSTNNPTAQEYPGGFPNPVYWYQEGPWTIIGGNTSTLGFVAHPFKNWSMIDGAAANGNILASLIRTLSFTFNKSDNFNPPPAAYTDWFGNPLAKPEGQEKDYGLEIATPDNKFFLRFTKFMTTNANQITAGGALLSNARSLYMDTEIQAWAQAIVAVRNGENPALANFNNTSTFPITPAEQSQIAAITGVPYNFGGNVGETGNFVNDASNESGVAKGYEVEATYNPLPNWTMKVTWGKQDTTVTGVAAQPQAWVTHRLPYWTSASVSDLTQTYTLANGTQMYLGNFWQGYGYNGTVTQPSASGWTTSQNYYNAVVLSQLGADEANNGTLAPNQREYSWSYLTNYIFDRGPVKGFSLGGALSYDGRETAGYYGNTALLNSTGQISVPNINQPIYLAGKYHIDAWVGYQFKMPWNDRINCKLQFNVADLTSNGYLLPVTFNFDGTPAGERIIPPRTYTLSAKFSF